MKKAIKSALVSVFRKEGLDSIIKELSRLEIDIYSTGGTLEYIKENGAKAINVEKITEYPSILGGRVKTLHPKIFGGILARRENEQDREQMYEFQIPEIDLVIVDLYPFKETVNAKKSKQEIIEKIDIGGVSLIRAAAKNSNDVLIISDSKQYNELLNILKTFNGETDINTREMFATEAFLLTSDYDREINSYFSQNEKTLRYGENPHQKAKFIGNFNEIIEQIHGKEISYNNLLDIDAAVGLISEFEETTFAVLKHNNPCGLASRKTLKDAWLDALAGDPISAFGGVLITNTTVDEQTAKEINKIFFEVIIAPGYEKKALEILKQKKNRIILLQKEKLSIKKIYRTILNGTIEQEKDLKTVNEEDLKFITKYKPSVEQIDELLFANKIVKHTKSNAIILTKNKQLLGGGVGQTSRVDALKQAIEKARNFEFDIKDSVMASDAFFPFSDSVEIAHKAGINAVIQPGGSIRDNETINYCNENNIVMVFTGIRHFKH